MHIVKQNKTKNSNNNNTCGQGIFSQKATKKNLFIKAWDSRRIKTKNDPTVAAAAPIQNPVFTAMYPFDDSVFLIRTTKKQQKKKFLFSVLFILKKREKNLKEKKS